MVRTEYYSMVVCLVGYDSQDFVTDCISSGLK